MRPGLLQSRKICFVEVESENETSFAEALSENAPGFVETLAEVPADTQILSVFVSERIEAAFLEAHPALELIATRSTGCDHIDLAACAARNVIVTNVADYGENTVAEHTFALLLALTRRLRDSEAAVRTGRFSRERLRGIDLRGSTLGVIGTGRIGMHVIRLGLGFGMKVIACDTSPRPLLRDLLDFEYVAFEDLLARSHVVSLHVPLTAETYHMINRQALELCQDGTWLINTSRGGLLDTEAVIGALDSGRLAGLGLDVLEDERLFKGGATSILSAKIAEHVHQAVRPEGAPSSARLAEFTRLLTHSQLLQREDVVFTPHVAYNSVQAEEALRSLTLENIKNYLAGLPLKHRCS